MPNWGGGSTGGGGSSPGDYNGGSDGGGYSGGWESQVKAGYQPGVGGSTVGLGGFGDPSSDISAAIASLPVAEQERLFRDYIDPTLTEMQEGIGATIAQKATTAVMRGLLNAAVPGLGTLAGITGATDAAYNALMDASFQQALGERLGVRDPNELSGRLEAAENDPATKRIIAETYQQYYGDTMANGAAGTAASYQQQALDYLKERESPYRQLTEGAAPMLGAAYGLPGYESTDFMAGFEASPYYQAYQSAIPAGEEAILRQAGATGGLRSGNVQDALARYSGDLQTQALQGYMGGLTGLTGLPSYAGQIAQTASGIGETLAMGDIAQQQMEQAELGQWLGLGASVLGASGGIQGVMDIGSQAIDWIGGLF